MPVLYSPVPLQLHLKALLEDVSPSAFVIEMIAMLFLDTVMEERRRESSSNSDKGAQSKSTYDQKWEDYGQLKCVQRQLERIGAFLYHYCISSTRESKIPPLHFH